MRRWEWGALIALGAFFFLFRLPLLTEPGLRLGWNSDAAVIGLMSRAMYEGTDFPIFFWQQSYLGTLTSLLAAVCGAVLSMFGVEPAVGPLAVRLAASIETFLAIVFSWLALRILFGGRAAMLAAFWLAVGPAFLYRFSFAPIGGEQQFFLGALIFWFALQTRLVRRWHWLVFGVLAGFGWWMHQGVVFAIVAALIGVIYETSYWNDGKRALALRDRFLLRGEALGWRADALLLAFLRVCQCVLIAWLVFGVLRAAGLRVPAFFFVRPIFEPLLGLLVFHVVIELMLGTWLREGVMRVWRDRREWLAPSVLFVSGALVGYLPVIIGRFRGWYPHRAGLSVPTTYLHESWAQAKLFVKQHVWDLIGADAVYAPLFAIVVAVLLIVAFARRAPWDRGRVMAVSLLLGTLFFALLSSRMHSTSVRYLVSALPILYGFAAAELVRMWDGRKLRGAAFGGTLMIFAVLCSGRAFDNQRLVDAKLEGYGNHALPWDPRPTLLTIERSGYEVCYAPFWVACKLDWVSDRRVRFISHHSYDRNPNESRMLAALPGPKCFVTPEGRVSAYVPSDESVIEQAKKRLGQ